MTVSLRNAGLATQSYERPAIPGVLRTEEDIANNTHPYPIVYYPLYFVCVCVECGKEVGQRRSGIEGALYDRLTHSLTHGGK